MKFFLDFSGSLCANKIPLAIMVGKSRPVSGEFEWYPHLENTPSNQDHSFW